MRSFLFHTLATSILVFLINASGFTEIQTVKQRMFDYFAGVGADEHQPFVKQTLAALGADANHALNTMQSNGSWPDVDNTDPDHAQAHFLRLFSMAQAYQTKGCQLFKNPQLKSSLETALNFANPELLDDVDAPRWWVRYIGWPRALGPILILMKNELDSDCF